MAKKVTCHCCGTVRVVDRDSGFIGVDTYYKHEIYIWKVRVIDNSGKTHHLGYYKTSDEARKVYDDYIINNKLVNRPLNYPKRGFVYE